MTMNKVSLLGVTVTPLTIKELNHSIGEAIKNHKKLLIPNHNLHSLYLYYKSGIMPAFYRKADLTHIDGMALILLGRLLGKPLKREHRVTYMDWLHPLLCMMHSNGWKMYYLGSKQGVIDQAEAVLKEQYPGLLLKTHHGYFDIELEGEANQNILAEIREYQPHLLFVGMGMPRQENWVLNNYDDIQANVVLMSGACMDYVAGVIPTPPRWMGKIGLEWLYRLCSEPKRLWKRYLIEPWFIVRLLIAEILFRRKREVEN